MSNAQAAAVVVMATTSAVMWWFWWQRWKTTGAIWTKAESARVPLNPLAVILALGMIGLMLGSMLLPILRPLPAEHDVLPKIDDVWRACLINGILVLVLLSVLSGSVDRPLAAFRFGLANWRRQFADGLETVLASFLPVLVVLLATLPFRSEKQTHGYLRLLQQDASPPTVGAVLFAAVVLAPLLEELLFRVILLEWLKTRVTAAEAIAVSSVAFAVVHGPLDGVALLPLAILLGCLYDAKRSFWSVFVAHACFNLWNIALTMSSN